MILIGPAIAEFVGIEDEDKDDKKANDDANIYDDLWLILYSLYQQLFCPFPFNLKHKNKPMVHKSCT